MCARSHIYTHTHREMGSLPPGLISEWLRKQAELLSKNWKLWNVPIPLLLFFEPPRLIAMLYGESLSHKKSKEMWVCLNLSVCCGGRVMEEIAWGIMNPLHSTFDRWVCCIAESMHLCQRQIILNKYRIHLNFYLIYRIYEFLKFISSCMTLFKMSCDRGYLFYKLKYTKNQKWKTSWKVEKPKITQSHPLLEMNSSYCLRAIANLVWLWCSFPYILYWSIYLQTTILCFLLFKVEICLFLVA